ncbi:MAG: glycosyltransferase family 2 protein [Ardenticatenaceae bacterium]|nr:glycosyltransferase family 2 protein [Ardenticatenaceae bacterium]
MNPNEHPLVSVVLPAYNEELAVEADLRTIRDALDASGYSYEILVVDDGSHDRTAAIAASVPGVQVLKHGRNRGTGAARSTGIRAARGAIIAMSDADGTYPSRDLPRLIEAILHGADMAVGARTVEAGTMRPLRTFAKESIRRLAGYMTASEIPDLNSGFRAVRRDVALRFLPVLPTTHSWVSTITLALLTNGYRVDYLPIAYFPRVGHSSFHPIRDTYNYLSLVVRTVTYFNPLKVFLPVSLLLFLIGLSKGTYDLIFNLRFRESDVVLVVVAVLIGMMGILADLIVMQGRRDFIATEIQVERLPVREPDVADEALPREMAPR